MKYHINSVVRFILILILSFSSQFLMGQYEDLQKDKNIIWVAEFFNDYSFSLMDSEREHLVKLIKFKGDASNLVDANHSRWIVEWIFNNAIDGHYDCYKDSGLTQPLSGKDLNGLITTSDTIVTFNPDTYEEMIQVVKNEIYTQQINSLRVNQVIYYDKKKKNFNTRIISVAPLLLDEKVLKKRSKKKKNKKILKPLFWIKMDGKLPKKFKVKSSNINWAALVLSKGNPIELNSIKTVKTNYGFDAKKRLYEQAFKFEKPVTIDYNSKEELKSEKLKWMYSRTDTVITFNPDTYEEQVSIVRHDVKPDEVSNIRLVQEWYFDKKSKRLMNRLKAISPMLKANDDNGKFRFWKRLYFIKYE